MTILIIVAFLISLISVNSIRQNLRNHLIDVPNARSSHTIPTPRGGGLGFIAAFASAIILGHFFTPEIVSLRCTLLLIPLLPLVAIGIIDDWKSVSSRIRYLIQLGVSILIVTYCGPFPQPWLTSFGSIGYGISVVLTIIGVTALINFYNFMDGLDGLVAGTTLIQLSFFAIWFDQPILWLLIAALLGFLYWNWSPAKIFMGDAGSTMLGATIAIILLQGSSPTQSWSALVLLLPLIGDATYTLICRLRRGENIFQAHRSHIYQRFHQSGLPHRQITVFYMLGTAIIGLVISLDPTIGPIMIPALIPIVIYRIEKHLSYVNHYQNTQGAYKKQESSKELSQVN